MPRPLWFLTVVLLLAACDRGAQPELVNQRAPEFAVQDSDRRVALQDLRGKVVVLNFWATWCPPCIEEMPSLVAMQRMLRGQVVVFAVSVDEDEQIYRKFLREYNIELLTVRDPAQRSNQLYGTTVFPETYIIDPSGVMRRKLVGPVQWTSPEMVAYLRQLAATAAPAASAENSLSPRPN